MAGNPFHLWLGLPKDLQSPNHFELLGVSKSETSPEILEKAAKLRLKQLAQVDSEKYGEVLQKIRKRIKIAFNVLADPNKRNAYLAKLVAPEASKQISNLRAADSARDTDLVKDADSVKDVDSAAEETGIPMAISLAPQESEPSNQEIELPIASDSTPSQNLIQGEKPKTTGGFEINTRRKIIKRRLPILPVLSILLFLIGLGGAIYFFMNYETLTARPVDNSPQNDPPPKTIGSYSETRLANKPAADSSSKSSNESPERKQTDSKKPNESDLPDSKSIDEENDSSGNFDFSDLPRKLDVGDEPPEKTDVAPKSNVKVEKLSFDDEVRFRRWLTAARLAMYRRDKNLTDQNIQNAKSLFNRFNFNGNLKLDPSQEEYLKVLDSTEKVREFLVGFWEQVVKSANQIPAGQELQVGGKLIGFVEGTEQFVIVRVGGQNRQYDYANLPPGLAMTIAEQGAKEDVPTYRLQKAAFYAVYQELDPTYGEKAKKFALESEPDGHDPAPITIYVDFPLEVVGTPQTQLQDLPKDLVQQELSELSIDNADVRRDMRPGEALAAVDSLLEASLATADPIRRAIRIRAAVLAARKTGDAFVMLDTTQEFAQWVVIDFNKEIEEGMEELAKNVKQMSNKQKRRFISLFDDYEKNFVNTQLAKRLAKVIDRLRSSM